jgi:hypothetical protein
MPPSSDRINEPVQPEDIDELRRRVEMLENRVYAAKVAYLNRSFLDGNEVSYEALSAIANQGVASLQSSGTYSKPDGAQNRAHFPWVAQSGGANSLKRLVNGPGFEPPTH